MLATNAMVAHQLTQILAGSFAEMGTTLGLNSVMMEILSMVMDARAIVHLKTDLHASLLTRTENASALRFVEMVSTWELILVMIKTLYLETVALMFVMLKLVGLVDLVISLDLIFVLRFVEMEELCIQLHPQATCVTMEITTMVMDVMLIALLNME